MFGVGYNMTIEKLNPTSFDSVHMTDIVTSLVREAIVLTDVGAEMTFQLPFAASGNFASLFSQMDRGMSKLGIRSYGTYHHPLTH